MTPRTVVYQARPDDQGPNTAAQGETTASPQSRGVLQPDTYSDKLLKYIPGETIAFYLPAYALAEGLGARYQIAVFLAGLVGTGIYMWIRRGPGNQSRWQFLLLACLSFGTWATGTSTFGQDIIGLDPKACSLLLAVAVFLIPMIDETMS